MNQYADNIPVLTEIIEGPDTAWRTQPEGAPSAAAEAPVSVVEETAKPTRVAPTSIALPRDVLMREMMIRFRAEWPQWIEAQCQATLTPKIALLAEQLAAELTHAMEASLLEWLNATLDDLDKQPPRA